jgi:small GTP-binding protein
MSQDKYDCVIKLLLIGDSGAGKTALLMRYAVDTFSPTYISTIGIDFKIKSIVIDNSKVKLQIWDTAGQERFRTITTSYYRGSHGVFIVYDVTDRESFSNIEKWLADINRLAPPEIAKILVGNKSDLADRRVVSTKDGQDLANKYNIKFFETSAKVGTNVNKTFEILADQAYRGVKNKENINPVKIPGVKIPGPVPTPNPIRSCC